MKKLILAIGAAALCSAGAAAAIHTPVAITGCVYAGTEPDTFVLLNVDEVTDGHAVPAGAVYWLSSTKGLKEHVGQKVEVRGTYSLDRDFGKTAKLTDQDRSQDRRADDRARERREKEPRPRKSCARSGRPA